MVTIWTFADRDRVDLSHDLALMHQMQFAAMHQILHDVMRNYAQFACAGRLVLIELPIASQIPTHKGST